MKDKEHNYVKEVTKHVNKLYFRDALIFCILVASFMRLSSASPINSTPVKTDKEITQFNQCDISRFDITESKILLIHQIYNRNDKDYPSWPTDEYFKRQSSEHMENLRLTKLEYSTGGIGF